MINIVEVQFYKIGELINRICYMVYSNTTVWGGGGRC